MKKLIAIAATGAVGAALVVSTAVLAAEELQELPEIVVQAGPVTKTVVGRAYGSGAPIEKVTVDYHVSYADLDLVKHADVLTLNKRVEGAAHDACQQLDELYPIERPKMRECTADAIHAASEQVQKAIAASQSRPAS
jgi:UrcA family protein